MEAYAIGFARDVAAIPSCLRSVRGDLCSDHDRPKIAEPLMAAMSSSHKLRTGTPRSLVLAAFVVMVVSGPLIAKGSAQVTDPFAAFAAATGVDVSVSNPSFPLGVATEGPGPNATTSANSLGTSDALASFPYLGAGLQGVPGLAAGLLQVPIPSYPFQASTNAGQDPDDVEGPGFALHAESGERRTSAEAAAGTEAIGSSTASRIERDDAGEVVAVAQSTTSIVDVAGLVTVTGVEASAEVVANLSSGELTRTSSISIGKITAPGLAITIPERTPDQVGVPVPVPGAPQLPVIEVPPVPLPMGGHTIEAPSIGFENGQFTIVIPGLGDQGFAIDDDVVIAAFKAIGIGVSIQAPEESATGITARALVLEHELPPNPGLQDPTTVRTTIGYATASVDTNPAAAPPVPPPLSIADGGDTVSNDGESGLPPASAGGNINPPALPGSSAPVTSEPAAAEVAAPVPATSSSPVAVEATLLYPILVAAGFATFVASHYIRLKGLRSWDY